MKKRICNICNIEKDIEQFSSKKDKNGKYYMHHYCKECEKEINKKYYNKEKIKQKNKLYRQKNKEKIKKYYNNEYLKKWRKENPDKVKKHIENMRKKINNDLILKMKVLARDNVRNAFRRKGYSKNTKTIEILGCNHNTFIKHLFQTFKNNYGYEYNGTEKVHIDHIIPLATAKTEDEIIKLCNYKNLQLLKAEDNIKKGCKLDYKIVNNSKEIL